MLKDCIGCQQRRLEDEPVEDRIRILCPACRITRYWNLYKHKGLKQTRMLSKKFNIITKLYCLKQVDSSHTDFKFIKSILLEDKQLSRFGGQLSLANYLGEIDRITKDPPTEVLSFNETVRENKMLTTTTTTTTTHNNNNNNYKAPKKKSSNQNKVHKTSNQCSYCKRYRLLDEPVECLQYRQCPRCIMKRRIRTNVSVPLAEPVKLYALKQFKELLPQDEDIIQRVYQQDSFLRQFKNKKFNFDSEIAKYRNGLRLNVLDNEEDEHENISQFGQRKITTEDLNFNHSPQFRVHISDIVLVTPDECDDRPESTPRVDNTTSTTKCVHTPLKIEPTYETTNNKIEKECSRCHGIIRDEPEILKGYKRCAKCTFNARLKVGTGRDVSKVIKICALKQVLEAKHYHTQSLKLKFLNDPFLSQFKKRTFNYKKELAKVTGK